MWRVTYLAEDLKPPLALLEDVDNFVKEVLVFQGSSLFLPSIDFTKYFW